MKKITLKSNYERMKQDLLHPIYDTNPIQELIKLRYLLALSKNEKELKQLDFNSTFIARFNNYANKIIGDEILERLDYNDKSAYNILKSETKRINNETLKYQTSKLRVMPYELMKYIVTEYVKEEEAIEKLDNLYSFLPKYNEQNNAKILRLYK